MLRRGHQRPPHREGSLQKKKPKIVKFDKVVRSLAVISETSAKKVFESHSNSRTNLERLTLSKHNYPYHPRHNTMGIDPSSSFWLMVVFVFVPLVMMTSAPFQIANPKFIQSHSERSPSGLLSTISVLNLPLKAHHFRVGRLHAKCVASMLTMHWQSLDVESLEESPTLLAASSHMEDRPPATNLSTIGSTKTKSNEEVKGNDKDSPFASLSLNHGMLLAHSPPLLGHPRLAFSILGKCTHKPHKRKRT